MFSVGDNVISAAYGIGTITSTDNGGQYPIIVDFDDEGDRTFTRQGEYTAGSSNTIKLTAPEEKKPIKLLHDRALWLDTRGNLVQILIDDIAIVNRANVKTRLSTEYNIGEEDSKLLKAHMFQGSAECLI